MNKNEEIYEPEAEKPERLFTGKISGGVKAAVKTDADEMVFLSFYGEIVFQTELEQPQFMPTQLVRLALYGAIENQSDDVLETTQALQAMDLTGPLRKTPVTIEDKGQQSSRWFVEAVPVRLYYSRLGDLAIAKGQEGKIAYPPEAEFGMSNFICYQEEKVSHEGVVRLIVEDLSFQLQPESVVVGGGLVNSVRFAPIHLTLRELKLPSQPSSKPDTYSG